MLHLGVVVYTDCSTAVVLLSSGVEELPSAVEVGGAQDSSDVEIAGDVCHEDGKARRSVDYSLLNFFIAEVLELVDHVASPLAERAVGIKSHVHILTRMRAKLQSIH